MLGLFQVGATGLLTYNCLQNLKKRERLTVLDTALQRADDLTICLPARNEEANLTSLLPALAAQTLRAAKVLVLDDQSTDGTADLLRNAPALLPELEALPGELLPPGWRGKVWALEQLLSRVETTYVLFLDADVRLERSGALAALYANAKARGGFVSVLPRSRTGSRGANVLVDQVYTHLYYLLPHNFRNWERPSAVAGSGQVMFFRAQELRELGGFGAVKNSTHDGLQLARRFKGAGRPAEVLDGFDAFSCLYYPSFAAAFRGFSRNSFESTSSVLATTAVCAIIFWVFVLPFILLPFLWLNPLWLMSFLILLYGQYAVARRFDLGWEHVALTPVKGAASIAVHAWGAIRELASVPTEWRGRAL